MKEYVPEYARRFRCVAEHCCHNCCIGWEIDIDEDTAAFYRAVPGDFGTRLRQNIGFADKTAYFIPNEQDRCPFLNEKNRCDIIETLGEGALCQICEDHPRFRNFFSDRVETGLGLSCEAAAELILFDKTPMALIEPVGDETAEMPTAEERAFFRFRAELFRLLERADLSLAQKLSALLRRCGAAEPVRNRKEEAAFFLALERLDGAWTALLTEWQNAPAETGTEAPPFESALARLAVYLVFRHFSPENSVAEAAVGVVRSVLLVRDLCGVQARKNSGLSAADLLETARLFSAEIEYSAENTRWLFGGDAVV